MTTCSAGASGYGGKHCCGVLPRGIVYWVMLAAVSLPSVAVAEIFACANSSIRVFADDARSGEAPLRILEGPLTGVDECYGLAVDVERGELWVAHGRISAFAIGASGNAPPLRTIFGPTTGMSFAVSIAVDSAGGEVVVGTVDGAMLAFPRTGNGDIPATRILQGAPAGVATIVGLAVDRAHGELLIASLGTPSRFYAFDRLAVGNAPPLRPPTDILSPGQLAYDAAADEVYLVTGDTVLVKNRTGVTLRIFTSGLFDAAYGLALRGDGEVLVGDRRNLSSSPDPIHRYIPDFGNAAPAFTIVNGALPQRTLWGLATSRASACSNGNVTSCLFRDGFEDASP